MGRLNLQQKIRVRSLSESWVWSHIALALFWDREAGSLAFALPSAAAEEEFELAKSKAKEEKSAATFASESSEEVSIV